MSQFAETANADTQALFSNSASNHRGQFKASYSASLWSGVKGNAEYKQKNSLNSSSKSGGQTKSTEASTSTKSK